MTGYSRQRGPHWPLPRKPLHAPRCWSTSWTHWWCNNLCVFQHASSEKRRHSPTLLQRGRSFQSGRQECTKNITAKTGENIRSQTEEYYKCSDQQYFQVTIEKVKLDQCHNKVTECQTAHHVCWQSAEVLLFLSWCAQFGKQRVDQCVLDVTEHGHGWVHLRQLLNDQDGGEECGASAVVLRVNLDTHELEKWNITVGKIEKKPWHNCNETI